MSMAADVGDAAPDFELEGTAGRFRLSEHRGRPVVLLFYPGDFTPVCTRQFCSYAERAEDLGDIDATVVGISPQDVGSHQRFTDENGIPVPLLADVDKKVARAFGVTAPIIGTRRAAIVVYGDGRVAHREVHALGLSYQSVDDIRALVEQLGTGARA